MKHVSIVLVLILALVGCSGVPGLQTEVTGGHFLQGACVTGIPVFIFEKGVFDKVSSECANDSKPATIEDLFARLEKAGCLTQTSAKPPLTLYSAKIPFQGEFVLVSKGGLWSMDKKRPLRYWFIPITAGGKQSIRVDFTEHNWIASNKPFREALSAQANSGASTTATDATQK